MSNVIIPQNRVASFVARGGRDAIKSLKVEFSSFQSGTGDPSLTNIRPIIGNTECILSHTKKNVFAGEDLRFGAMTGHACTDYPDSSDPLNSYVTFASNASYYRPIVRDIFKPNTQYTFLMTLRKTSGSGSNLRVYYTDGTYDNIPNVTPAATIVRVRLVTDAGKTVDFLRKIQSSGSTRIYYNQSGIFEGSVEWNEFEDYINNSVLVKFPVNGKNIFDCNLNEGYYIASTGVVTRSTSSAYSNLIPVTEGETYTYSGIGGSEANNKRIHGYTDGVWQQEILMQSITGQFAVQFTVPTWINGIRISAYPTDAKRQIELGSTATDYEPYTGVFYDGVIDVAAGTISYANDGMVLTGNEEFSLVSAGTDQQRFVLDIPENAGTGMVSHGPLINTFTGVFGQFRITASGAFCILDGGLNFSSVADLQQYLADQCAAGTPVQFVYNFEEPEIMSFDPVVVTPLSGENNIWADIGDIEVVYSVEDRITILVNGTDITDYFVPTGIRVQYKKVLGRNGGTYLSGDREEDLLAWKAVIKITCMPLTEIQQSDLITKITVDDPTLYYFDPRINGYRTIHCMMDLSEVRYRGKGSNYMDYWTGLVLTAEEK